MPIQEDPSQRPSPNSPSRQSPRSRWRRSRRTREGHRALERRRHIRRQGHRLPVLEARAARAGLPLSRVRRRPHGPLWATFFERRERPSAVRRRRLRLQRHRRPAVVPAEAAQAGADCRGPSGRRRAIASLLVRDGGALARDGARARLRAARRTRRTRSGRSWRCRAARVSASRPTICSTR